MIARKASMVIRQHQNEVNYCLDDWGGSRAIVEAGPSVLSEGRQHFCVPGPSADAWEETKDWIHWGHTNNFYPGPLFPQGFLCDPIPSRSFPLGLVVGVWLCNPIIHLLCQQPESRFPERFRHRLCAHCVCQELPELTKDQMPGIPARLLDIC